MLRKEIASIIGSGINGNIIGSLGAILNTPFKSLLLLEVELMETFSAK